MKAVIIGSGLSGLTAGAALAQAGHEVTVFEQFHRAGGVTASYEREGYKWDLGQLLVEGFGADEPAGAVLAELGVLDKIRVRVDDRGYVFPDFELKKPKDFRQRTLTDHHAFGGIAPWMGAWRVPHTTPIGGLWFVGAQSESGGGVSAVIPSAYKTAQRILQGFQVKTAD